MKNISIKSSKRVKYIKFRACNQHYQAELQGGNTYKDVYVHYIIKTLLVTNATMFRNVRHFL